MSLHVLVSQLLNIYSIIIFIYCMFTWFPRAESGFFADAFNVLERICDPYLNIFRRFIPTAGGIDFSPILAILILVFLANGLNRLLISVGL